MSDTLYEKIWPHAQAAGLVDRDALALLDTSSVRVDKSGKPKIPVGFFDEARTEKPHLFKRARDMTPEQRKSFLKEHTRRHGL